MATTLKRLPSRSTARWRQGRTTASSSKNRSILADLHNPEYGKPTGDIL